MRLAKKLIEDAPLSVPGDCENEAVVLIGKVGTNAKHVAPVRKRRIVT